MLITASACRALEHPAFSEPRFYRVEVQGRKRSFYMVRPLGGRQTMTSTNAPTAIIVGLRAGRPRLRPPARPFGRGSDRPRESRSSRRTHPTRSRRTGTPSTVDQPFSTTLRSSKKSSRPLGVDAHKELGLMPLDPMYRLVFGAGGHIDATSNLDEMTERIRELAGDKNADGFKNYVKQNRKEARLLQAVPPDPVVEPTGRISQSEPYELRPSSSHGPALLETLASTSTTSEFDSPCRSKRSTSA